MTALPRLVFFDMEGTLLRKDARFDDRRVAPSAWTVLAHELGEQCFAEENETKEKWNRKEYANYLQWMRATVDIHKKYGLRRELYDRVVNSVSEVPNARIVLKQLHGAGVVTALVTGGFKQLADRVQRSMRIPHAFAGCDYFFDDDGLLDHVNLLPADEVGKADFMRLMCREYGFDPKDCAFVGDGMNDVHLAQQVGYSVAFNGQPALCAVASSCVEQPSGSEDFMPVGELLRKCFADR